MILALDLSTTCSGYSIIDLNGNLIAYGAIKTPSLKFNDLYEKLIFINNSLLEIKKKYNISHIFIEEILGRVSVGAGSSKTILLLAKLNGTISYKCYEIFNIKPVHISANSARASCGIKKINKDIKDDVLKFWRTKFPSIIIERGPRGGVDKSIFDIVDSLSIAFAGLKSI